MKYLSIVALMVATQAHAQLPQYFERPKPTPDPDVTVEEEGRLMIFDEDDHIMIVDLDTGDYTIILKDER